MFGVNRYLLTKALDYSNQVIELMIPDLRGSVETFAKREEGIVKKKEDLKECTEDKTGQNDTA